MSLSILEPAATETTGEKIECKSCERHVEPKEIHTTGVCIYCHRAFAAAGKSWLAGRSTRLVEQESEHRVEFQNTTTETATHFDFCEIDELLGFVEEQPLEARQQAADVLGRILAWSWGSKQLNLRTALARFTAATMTLRPELVGNLTFKEVGTLLGVTRASVSRWSVRFTDAFGGIQMSRSRPKSSRERMSKAQMGHANFNKRKPTAKPDITEKAESIGQNACARVEKDNE